MAPQGSRLTPWGGSDHVVSPVGSGISSIVSIDSILPDTHEKFFGVHEAAETQIKGMGSVVIEQLGNRINVGKYLGVGDSFIRHPKYFFRDGNVTFLVDGTLYCIHRYFFSRDSVYFSTRFSQLDIRDHEALPTIISLGDVKPKEFDALLCILYPEDFEGDDLCYEEWESVLHLSTRWGFTTIRELALSSIGPPTSHERLRLARTYSVDHWVAPALSGLCERTSPLTLSEARQMSVEDVVLVATVREDIRGHALIVDATNIPRRVEAAQAGKSTLSEDIDIDTAAGGPVGATTIVASSPMNHRQATVEGDAYKSDGGRLEVGIEKSAGDNSVRPGDVTKRVVADAQEDSVFTPYRKKSKSEEDAKYKYEEAKREVEKREAGKREAEMAEAMEWDVEMAAKVGREIATWDTQRSQGRGSEGRSQRKAERRAMWEAEAVAGAQRRAVRSANNKR